MLRLLNQAAARFHVTHQRLIGVTEKSADLNTRQVNQELPFDPHRHRGVKILCLGDAEVIRPIWREMHHARAVFVGHKSIVKNDMAPAAWMRHFTAFPSKEWLVTQALEVAAFYGAEGFDFGNFAEHLIDF